MDKAPEPKPHKLFAILSLVIGVPLFAIEAILYAGQRRDLAAASLIGCFGGYVLSIYGVTRLVHGRKGTGFGLLITALYGGVLLAAFIYGFRHNYTF